MLEEHKRKPVDITSVRPTPLIGGVGSNDNDSRDEELVQVGYISGEASLPPVSVATWDDPDAGPYSLDEDVGLTDAAPVNGFVHENDIFLPRTDEVQVYTEFELGPATLNNSESGSDDNISVEGKVEVVGEGVEGLEDVMALETTVTADRSVESMERPVEEFAVSLVTPSVIRSVLDQAAVHRVDPSENQDLGSVDVSVLDDESDEEVKTWEETITVKIGIDENGEIIYIRSEDEFNTSTTTTSPVCNFRPRTTSQPVDEAMARELGMGRRETQTEQTTGGNETAYEFTLPRGIIEMTSLLKAMIAGDKRGMIESCEKFVREAQSEETAGEVFLTMTRAGLIPDGIPERPRAMLERAAVYALTEKGAAKYRAEGVRIFQICLGRGNE